MSLTNYDTFLKKMKRGNIFIIKFIAAAATLRHIQNKSRMVIYNYSLQQLFMLLGEPSKKSLTQNRRKLIEQAYQKSQLQHYRIPRNCLQEESGEDSLEDIPKEYNLYSQNQSTMPSCLLSLDRLIALNSKSILPSATLTKRTSAVKIGFDSSRQSSRKSRINCTLTKHSSKERKPKHEGSWWCCLKQEREQQFQIREIDAKLDWLHTKILPFSTLTQTNITKMIHILK